MQVNLAHKRYDRYGVAMSTEPTDPTRPYVSVNLTRPARNALQRLTLRRSADLGRRLTLSDVLLSALALADADADAHLAAITEMIGETPS